ncbi:MAG: hypothetical protein LQ352_004020 [Teloschistes flavicans]|nr:MAG: hypothetical protein LQ352_004020 [Teloschistes flavicans]
MTHEWNTVSIPKYELTSMEEEIERLKKEVIDKTEEVETAYHKPGTGAIWCKNREIGQLMTELKKIEDKIDGLYRPEGIVSRHIRLEDELKSKTSEVTKLTELTKELMVQKEQALISYQNLSAEEIESLQAQYKSKLARKENEIERLRAEHKSELALKEQEIEELQRNKDDDGDFADRLRISQDNGEKQSRFHQKLWEKKCEIAAYSDALSKANNLLHDTGTKLQTTEAKLHNTTKAKEALLVEKQAADKEVRYYKAKKRDIKAENKKLGEEKESFLQDLQQVQHQVEELTSQVNQLTETNFQLTREKWELADRLTDLTQDFEQYRTASTNEKEALEEELQTAKDKVEAFKKKGKGWFF